MSTYPNLCEGRRYREFLDGRIIAAVEEELSNGPDARTEIPCPACKGGADDTVTIAPVVAWRVYPNFVVQLDCDGCGFSREVAL